MTESEINVLVETWIDEWSDEDSTEHSVQEILTDLYLSGEFDHLWQFISTAYQYEMSERVFAILAAGPLEDLLAYAGCEFIDRVELLARKDPRFNRLLSGVWKNSIPNDVWDRILALRDHNW